MSHIMNANNKLCDFKQWCQLVLPLVYDGSLSYYEVLDKVVIYLNKTTKSVKSIYPVLDEIIKELSDMQETLDNLDNIVDDLVREYLNSPEFLNKLSTLTTQLINEALIPIREVLATKADISDIPTKTSELTNDSNFVSDANYVHTDNNFSNSYKTKLDGIENGAEINVQSDWNVSDSTSDAFIKNKPTIPTKTSDLTNDSNFVSDSNYVHTDNNFSNSDKTKLDGIENGAEINVQSDWNVSDSSSDAFIKNKPTIPTKTSDLTNDNGFITEGDIPTKTSDLINDSGFITEGDIPTKTSDLINDSNFISDANYVHTDNNFTNNDKTKLDGIATGAEVNVQSDWNVSDSNSDAFIKNKPTIPTQTSQLTNNSGFITVSQAPVQSTVAPWNTECTSTFVRIHYLVMLSNVTTYQVWVPSTSAISVINLITGAIQTNQEGSVEINNIKFIRNSNNTITVRCPSTHSISIIG